MSLCVAIEVILKYKMDVLSLFLATPPTLDQGTAKLTSTDGGELLGHRIIIQWRLYCCVIYHPITDGMNHPKLDV